MEQIAIIRPRVICTLGRFATKLLAETELSMTAIHGKAKQREIGGVDVIVFPVFHPRPRSTRRPTGRCSRRTSPSCGTSWLDGLARAARGDADSEDARRPPRRRRRPRPRPGAAGPQGQTRRLPPEVEQLPLW